MLPTRTTVALLTVGLLIWLAGLTAPLFPQVLPSWLSDPVTASRYVVLGFDAAVLLLFVLDASLARRATHPARLRVRRERPARLSLGVDNDIVVVLDNANNRRLTLLVRDLPPP